MTRRTDYLLRGLVLALAAGVVGCKQQMGDQPYYRPYEPTEFFEDGRSNRPLERGVVHRGQYLDSDPLVTGLTQEEWGRFWARGDRKAPDPAAPNAPEDRQTSYGAPRFDPRPGQPNSGPQVFVTEFPFEITARDLAVGGQRFTQFCAMCHGPLGDGKGKIWERGYLRPTSFHTEAGDATEFGQVPYGFSRGFWKWDVRIPMRDVPVGYFFEVITKGYGAMGSYAAQIKPEDRWRIIAYVRALQLSQRADVGTLPADVVGRLNAGGNQP
jgi:mono/diheme cytochrome c family protein